MNLLGSHAKIATKSNRSFQAYQTEIKNGLSVREDRSANYQNCHRRSIIAIRSLRWLRGHERDGFATQTGIEGFD